MAESLVGLLCLLEIEKYQQSVVDFDKLISIKRSPKVYYWWKHSQNLRARVSELRFFPNSTILLSRISIHYAERKLVTHIVRILLKKYVAKSLLIMFKLHPGYSLSLYTGNIW